ncbi:helix-turn-helix domain-containing protein [Nocardia sp. A7]|uniref:arsenate reductase/protein-tyrosine-phosphatase family protein n=1 Tax=Nocardia sp. A7 TaxID=2789274 RepID=UPI00397B591B
MNIECDETLSRRVAVHAALADPARLRIVDALVLGDASPSDLAQMLGIRSNLLAHHLQTLTAAGVVTRQRSEGDRRRTYVRLLPRGLEPLSRATSLIARRVVFVCTANSARSQLAAALWCRGNELPAASAGTHPADRINPGAVDVAERHELALMSGGPQRIDDVLTEGDLVVTVCDRAYEELPGVPTLHWSIPDPVGSVQVTAFDTAYDDIATRVESLARHVRCA